MENTPEKYKSLFDTIDEQSGKSCPFNWLSTTHMCVSSEDLLLEGTLLIVSRRGGLLKQRRCVLTYLYIIRYNVMVP